MQPRLPLIRSLAAALLLGLGASACAQQVSIHDPAMAKDGDTYYLFSTGPGITVYESKDMVHWTLDGPVFKPEPTWARTAIPNFAGHLWAPDVVHHDGKFYLYYSASAFGKNTSAIGVTVTKTLDIHSPDYGWQDQGIVLQSVPHRDLWNAIDPQVAFDDNGAPWMSFGSFWDGIKLVKLDKSLTKIAEPQQWYSLARQKRPAFTPDSEAGPGEIEGPFIFKHDDYYYLFVSFGLCCRGVNSTYHLAVGRSKVITGPYLDKSGKDMADGGGTVFLKGNKAWPGLGHNSAYHWDGKDYLVFHAYEAADNGLQKLKIAPIEWQDGWPTVDPKVLDSFKSQLEP
ncbi:arabinan endo-1,5-alpha-L-arabinosidase [Gallaecimonas pentaromativorans]|uniref:arabinan endo-1,5-alpha-L-arabinosidase n=1 Tax=Gallaecimonas pentaromativorans TaxID=584787 RepID=UPI00067F1801|nr:arabinan endo-1,5-alpha-L-arabinosidase [Gallaecimonas pentaromativorans]MED5524832.1 arabinan endo-1,5-alpha-L-arabinosidase [Pseudomonadota bacterium]